MQRRQALGVISANFNQVKPNTTNAGPFKPAAKAPSSSAFNDENEVLQSMKTSKSSEMFDFDIYQEEAFVETKSLSAQNAAKKQEIKLKESITSNLDYIESISVFANSGKSSNKENVSEKPHFDICGDEDDEEEEEDEEDEDDEEEEENDDNGILDEEEEGISRLNLAAVIENTLDEYKDGMIISDQELVSMMDSSSVHPELSSPMILDDTIKYQSHSHLSVTHDIDEDDKEAEADEELDEDEKRKQMLSEQDNLLMSCLEYKDDILVYMRQQEQENRPKANYMKKQQDVNSSMRCILVDWLVEVCEEYRLNMETLYLAVNYTDRFLSQMSVLRGKLQLVGTASMYIASKYEEITPPDVSEFVYITDDTYTKKQVLRMEHLLLKVLDFKMNAPTANWFLNHYLRFAKRHFGFTNQDELHRFESLARFLAELTLIDADTFLCFLPSQIAASAIYLALLCFDRPWTKQIADALGYGHDLSELKSCIVDMFKAMQHAPTQPQQAIMEKYKSSKYNHASLIVPPKQLPACFDQQSEI